MGELRHSPWRDMLPALAVIACDVNEPVIGRGPDLAPPVRRGGERCACRVHLGPGVFTRDIAAGRLLPRNIVETDIRRNFPPAHDLVSAAKHMVASRIQYPAVVRRKNDRECPGEAVSYVLGCYAKECLGPDIHQLDLPGTMVVALQRPGAARSGANRAAIDDVRIFRMHGDKAAFPGAGIGAVPEGNSTPDRGAGRRDRGVVLLRGVDAIGILVVGVDAIKLRRWLVVDRRPGLATVAAYAGAAIV